MKVNRDVQGHTRVRFYLDLFFARSNYFQVDASAHGRALVRSF